MGLTRNGLELREISEEGPCVGEMFNGMQLWVALTT